MDEATEKDRLLMAALANVPFDGWSIAALLAGARAAGIAEAEALALFPRGAADLDEWFSGWADRAMLARLDSGEFSALKVRDRVAAGVRARLAVLGPHREAARSALAVLALPQNVPLGLKLVYHTVDAIWYAAGDTATDFNFYTKRGLLAAVHGATTLHWLADRSPASVDTDAFLERRLADAMAGPQPPHRRRAPG